MAAVFPDLSAATYRRHDLHDAGRAWPETNCHTDLFIELLATLGREPAAALGMTLAQDFEGDQFTFFKIPNGDLDTLFGLDLQELSIYRPLVDHLEEQVARGRIVLVEVDAHFLPDTRGVTYRTDHSKTTIAVNAFDRAAAHLGYFHNAGYFEMEGEDVHQLLGFGSVATPVLPPYTEFVKVTGPGLSGRALRDAALARLAAHWARRPERNPVLAYRAALQRHLDWLAGEPPCSFHPYAFNTARQFGANMALLGDHLVWLSGQGVGGLERAVALCEAMSGGMKTFQFLLARALARKKTEALAAALDETAGHYDALMTELAAALRFPMAETRTLVRAAS
ncbi:MAG: DUF1839 family protein [Phreatobacter sp.]|uniref:DUF1839 family protein n=1 Tax=Phreatobacter sp. TaxID=1966341 RepID=UPI004036D999